MGTWGAGPFENDAADDLLLELGESDAPAIAVAALLEGISELPGEDWLDVDDGQACVAMAELVALAFGPGVRPAPLAALIESLEADPSLVQKALDALPRVFDKQSSELAQLWHEIDHLDALYERLVEVSEGRAALPLLDLKGLLASRPSAPRTELQPPQPWSVTAPDLDKMIDSSPALRATTVAHGSTWSLVTNGVLNVYGDLAPGDLERLAAHPLTQVQFARRFQVSSATVAVLDELFSRTPRARLALVLNGFGAFDDLEVLARLPHLRDVVVQGRAPFLNEGAGEILARFPFLVRVVVEGAEAWRGQ
jgi:hypothetical protein